MKSLLEQIYTNGRTILHKNVDLTENCNPKERLDPETFHNMNDVLDKHLSEFDKCSAFVIEAQMKTNNMATKLGQHCYSYFTFHYGRMKQIIEFPAYHKTQVLGAPKVPGKKTKKGTFRWKAMEKPARKKWAVEKAKEILTLRGELNVLETVKTARKKDDLCDVICQLKAAQYKIYVEKKL